MNLGFRVQCVGLRVQGLGFREFPKISGTIQGVV